MIVALTMFLLIACVINLAAAQYELKPDMPRMPFGVQRPPGIPPYGMPRMSPDGPYANNGPSGYPDYGPQREQQNGPGRPPYDYDIVKQVSKKYEGGRDLNQFSKDEEYALNDPSGGVRDLADLEAKLTYTGKWEEFLTKLKEQEESSSQIPWEQDAQRWGKWIRDAVKEKEKQDEKEANEREWLASRPGPGMPYPGRNDPMPRLDPSYASPGMSSYWGGAEEEPKPAARTGPENPDPNRLFSGKELLARALERVKAVGNKHDDPLDFSMPSEKKERITVPQQQAIPNAYDGPPDYETEREKIPPPPKQDLDPQPDSFYRFETTPETAPEEAKSWMQFQGGAGASPLDEPPLEETLKKWMASLPMKNGMPSPPKGPVGMPQHPQIAGPSNQQQQPQPRTKEEQQKSWAAKAIQLSTFKNASMNAQKKNTTKPMKKEDVISQLPVRDDFGSPIKWVKFSSKATEDGLAKVTNPYTGRNRQATINGSIYVPVIDYNLQRLGLTTERSVTVQRLPAQEKAVFQTLMDSVDMEKIDERDWFAVEVAIGGAPPRSEGCVGETCQSRCATLGCQTQCTGDTCASGCIANSCTSFCKGPGCYSMCIGEYCNARCDGQACDARCRGKGCQSKCQGFSCHKTTNGDFKVGGGQWNQNYPQYDTDQLGAVDYKN